MDSKYPGRGKLRAVLWDLDGVLVDSVEPHYQSWRLAMAEFDLPLNRTQFLEFYGCAPAQVTAGVIGDDVGEDIKATIRQRKDALFNEIAPGAVILIPRAMEIVQSIHGVVPQAVATSATMQQASLVLENTGLSGYFQALATSSEAPGKPDPGIFLLAAHKLGVKPSECLVIEDSPHGIEAAHRAGMVVVAVCTTHPPEALARADLVLPDLAHLEAVIHRQGLALSQNCL